MESITLFVSPYSERNKHLVKWKAKAERLFRYGRDDESRTEFEHMTLPGTAYLERAFADFTPAPKLTRMVGMFQGVLEPSTQFEMEFSDEADRIKKSLLLKRRAIDFGRSFDQSNVHIVTFKAQRPHDLAYGAPDPQQADITYQKNFTLP